MSAKGSLPVFLVLAAAAYGPLALRRAPDRRFAVEQVAAVPDGAQLFGEGFLPLPPHTPRVHSATAVRLSDGRLLAAWFGGSEEGAPDVAIYAAAWDRGWSAPWRILDRERAQRDLGRYIDRLGNPVLSREGEGRLRLVFVTTSLGGWSTSALNTAVSPDGGATWSRARRLVTSPLLNLGTLVRNAPLAHADGSLVLPVSHELVSVLGETVRLVDGRVRGRSRISRETSSLQPALVSLDARRAVAFLRRQPPGRLLRSETRDGGRTWSAPTELALPNPEAAIAALRLPDGRLLLAYNHTEHGRGDLSLAVSADEGQSWRRVHVVENEADEEFSYPYLLHGDGGVVHLLYTWKRRRIKHVRFNQAWLRRRP
ncbi:MAG: sialidase family protein [Planctomycetota bacterium]